MLHLPSGSELTFGIVRQRLRTLKLVERRRTRADEPLRSDLSGEPFYRPRDLVDLFQLVALSAPRQFPWIRKQVTCLAEDDTTGKFGIRVFGHVGLDDDDPHRPLDAVGSRLDVAIRLLDEHGSMGRVNVAGAALICLPILT